jgi:hypothetical protein
MKLIVTNKILLSLWPEEFVGRLPYRKLTLVEWGVFPILTGKGTVVFCTL